MGVVLCVCTCVHAFKEQETIVHDMRKSGKESEMCEHSIDVLSVTLNVRRTAVTKTCPVQATNV